MRLFLDDEDDEVFDDEDFDEAENAEDEDPDSEEEDAEEEGTWQCFRSLTSIGEAPTLAALSA